MVQKITIIGGSGFVGTFLSHEFSIRQQDFEIVDLKMSNQFPEKCKIADVRDIDSLRKTISGDVVVNLAAVHRDDVSDTSEYYRTNVDGAENVALVCSEKGIRKIIFTSTVAVYGFAKSVTDENGKINPFNDYGRSKFEAEKKLCEWQSKKENSLIIVRPTVIFGEGNRGNVYNLVNQIASRRFLMIGSGANKKSMAYVGNVVAFLDACISSNKKYEVFNYVDTPSMDMNALVKHVKKSLLLNNKIAFRLPYWLGLSIGYFADGVARLTGISLPISSIRVRKFCAPTEFMSKKNSLEGFQAPFTLVDGLDRTIASEFIKPDPDREIFFTE